MILVRKCKKYLLENKKNEKGFTLIEVMVSLAVVSLLMTGFYDLMLMSLKVTADNAGIVEATEIANQKMERIRNMKYDDVGTLTGSPHGLIQEHETVNRNGLFEVHTMVVFFDDPYDGTLASGTDSIFVDYKIATIDVSWVGRYGPKKITVFTKIVPNTQETLAGYGLLKLMTVDSSGAIVPNAIIHVQNKALTVYADYVSDTSGQFNLALLPGFEDYEVTVSKSGYSTEKTFARDLVNLNPTKPNITIIDGVKTEESFSIDHLANLTIRTVSNNLPDNWRVNTLATVDSVSPKIGLDQADNAYFVWQKNDVLSSTVYMQKYDSANTKQWANDLAINSSASQVNPDIATEKSGKSYVVWQDNSVSLKLLALDTNGYINKIAKIQSDFGVTNKLKSFAIAGKEFWFNKFKSLWSSLLALGKREVRMQNAVAATTVTVVQSKISAAVNSSNLISLNLDSTPTVGNVLIAIAVHSHAGRTFNVPTTNGNAFTVSRYSDTINALDVGIWHKVFQSSDTKNVQITLPSGQYIDGGVLMVMEVSGLDKSNLLNVTTANDQTSGVTSKTAFSGNTTNSSDNAFAVSAAAFENDGFSTPTNSNWTSASANFWVQQLWTDWVTGNDGSLAVATMNINAAAVQSATVTLTGGSNTYRNSALAVFNVLPPEQTITSAVGSQNANVVMPQSDYYLGGKFVVVNSGTSRNVNSVKLQEFGTVDAQAKISSVKLYYDLDTTAPFDCASESYNPGTDLQYGSASTFDGPDGFATITQAGGVNITTTKTLCLYPVVSVSSTNNNETLDIKINNPSTDVVISSGNSTPISSADISGSTILIAPANINQMHARLRKDNGDENGATWRNYEDVADSIYLSENLRIRFEMANLGGVPSTAMAYRLEYGELTTSCDAITTWNAVPNNSSLAWETVGSSFYANGAFSSNISNGLTDENSTFKASQLMSTGNQVNSLSLASGEFAEMEYDIKANPSVGDKTFCFRLTDQGDASVITYKKYAVVTTKGDENIFIRAVDANGNFVGAIKKVNADTSDANQVNPVIALTEKSGVATTSVAWEDNRNGNSDIYLQILDADGVRQLPTDLRVTNNTDNNYEPSLAFDSSDNLYVAWVDNSLSKDIYISKYDLGGNLLSGPIALKNSADQEYNPQIKFDNADNLYLTYTREASGIKKVYIAKYDSTLATVWEKNPNNGGVGFNHYNGSLGVYNTTIYTTWTDERNANKDIYAQKLDSSGNPIWANDLKLNIGLDSADQIGSSVAVRSNLNAVGVWQDNRNAKNEIYATEFNDPGSLIGVSGVPLEIVGTKKIGENPIIYKYNQVQTTDANGYLHLSLDWDVPGYSVFIHTASSSKTIILRDPPQSLVLSPADNKTMIIYVQ